jgi:hypothetical protein
MPVNDCVIGQIELSESEQQIAEKIVFDNEGYIGLARERAIENGELAASLMGSLLNRGAIPKIRLRYFTDADYNPGPGNRSRHAYFRQNAGSDEAVFRHGHFLPFLRYFVYGAELPDPVKEAFLKRAQDPWIKEEDLVNLARTQVRELLQTPSRRDHTLPDRFYQLALDCGVDEGQARIVREAVMRVSKAR